MGADRFLRVLCSACVINALQVQSWTPTAFQHPRNRRSFNFRSPAPKQSALKQTTTATYADGENDDRWVLKTAGALTVSGALLGPNLDNFHSAFGVLEYASPIVLRSPIDNSVVLTTAVFTPPLFGLAAIIIGGLYIFLDERFDMPQETKMPSVSVVLVGIACFCSQYWLSGLLCSRGFSLIELHAALIATMIASFVVFDRSLTGIIVGIATGVGGPLIELFLINQLQLYKYLQADFFGIDSWIPWVYAAGAPAVGNLARAYKCSFTSRDRPVANAKVLTEEERGKI